MTEKNPNKKLSNKELRIKGIKNAHLKKKLGEKCVYCGCTNKLVLTIDHKKPIIRGGKDLDKNKQVACHICNWIKGGLTHNEFKKYYKALMTMKELNKVNLCIGNLQLFFHSFKLPKSLKDVKEDKK